MKSNIRNEIKAQIIRAGYTMQEVVDQLHDEYGWSDSVSNLSGKLQRESLRYRDCRFVFLILADNVTEYNKITRRKVENNVNLSV